MATIIKLEDIPLRYIGLPGEKHLKAFEEARNYEKMKFASLDIFNDAGDRYLDSESETNLMAMSVAKMNNVASVLMWYYHEQIHELDMEQDLASFVVCLYKTQPFELPASQFYHNEPVPDDGVQVPFIDFYQEMIDKTKMEQDLLVYDIIIRPR